MKLKKGITGFWHTVEDEPVPSVDVKHIKLAILSIENAGVYKVTAFKEPDYSNNYYRISLADKLKNDELDILVNAHHPYYCGVTFNSSWMALKFIDLPSDIRKCLDNDFNYLTPKELNLKPNREDLVELSKAELQEVEFWKSTTIGEIIFNGYD